MNIKILLFILLVLITIKADGEIWTSSHSDSIVNIFFKLNIFKFEVLYSKTGNSIYSVSDNNLN